MTKIDTTGVPHFSVLFLSLPWISSERVVHKYLKAFCRSFLLIDILPILDEFSIRFAPFFFSYLLLVFVVVGFIIVELFFGRVGGSFRLYSPRIRNDS